MNERDQFKEWMQENLKEEMHNIRFSPEARSQVKEKIAENNGKNTNKDANIQVHPNWRNNSWLNKKLALPWTAIAACFLCLFIVTGLYTRTLFYVTPQEIASYQSEKQIIIPRANTPFGAIQMASLELPDKGVSAK